MEVLILAAGSFLRYSSEKPKLTLHDYKGHMMLETIIRKIP